MVPRILLLPILRLLSHLRDLKAVFKSLKFGFYIRAITIIS